MKRYIRNAEEGKSKQDMVAEAIDILEDDFKYAVDGIYKLSADGDTDKALELASSLSQMVNASIEEIAEGISTGE